MAPAMTGPQTAAAEIAKITAMRAHDHQSLSPDIATDFGTARLLAAGFVRRSFGMVHLSLGLVGGADGLQRSKPDEKCDGRDQDCAARNTSRLMTAAVLRGLFGLILGLCNIRHCTFQECARPQREGGAWLTNGGCRSRSVPVPEMDGMAA